MSNYQFVATVSVFKGEDEVGPTVDQVMEVVEFIDDSGRFQFGVDGPKGTRIFVTLDVAELVAAAVNYCKPETE